MKFKLLILLLLPVLGFSQVAKNEMNRQIFGNPFSAAHQNYFRAMSSNNELVKQDKYFLYSDWSSVEVLDKNNNLTLIDSCNYYIPENKFLFFKDGALFVLYPSHVSKVNVEGDTWSSCKEVEKKKGTQELFCQVLVEGPISLFKKYEVKEKRVSNNPMGIADVSKVEIIQKSTFYYSKNGKIEKLPKKKKDLAKIFTGFKTKMIKYADQNKLSSKKEKDLIALFNYYAHLVSNEE